MREFLIACAIVTIFIAIPVLIYFCVKLGTVGFYKAKQFMDKEQKH